MKHRKVERGNGIERELPNMGLLIIYIYIYIYISFLCLCLCLSIYLSIYPSINSFLSIPAAPFLSLLSFSFNVVFFYIHVSPSHGVMGI